MRVLVTGGAGFIGANLVRRLVERGDDVVVLDDFSTGLRENLTGLDVDIREGTLADPDAVVAATADTDAVVHLGARGSVPRSVAHPVATHVVNATGTLNVLEAARGVGAHVVFSGSSSVYGANPQLPKREDTWTRPISPYAASKLAAEGYVLAYGTAFDLPTLAFRFFNVFGPWQRPDHDYAAVVPKWIWAILRGEVLDVHGDGRQTRDFTYVDSVVDVLVSALDRRLSHDSPVNLAFGRRHSLLDLLERLERVVGVEPKVRFVEPRATDVRDSENDPALLTSLFPDAHAVDLDDALARTTDWLRTRA